MSSNKRRKGATFDSSGLDLKLFSNKAYDDKELKDPPSRLFRQILRSMNLNSSELMVYINDHLKWDVNLEDPKSTNKKRSNDRGNIRATFFNSDTMTLPKLLAGLSILKAKGVTITLDVEFHDRDPITVSETAKIHSSYDDKEEPK